eukprot:TCALIF_10695-PA protein Name:"Similar to tsl Torso-like protein (Drosophila melanogaster)" AED:0.25 eAED:0.25 QI:0/0/0/0.75/1/1/4/0/382
MYKIFKLFGRLIQQYQPKFSTIIHNLNLVMNSYKQQNRLQAVVVLLPYLLCGLVFKPLSVFAKPLVTEPRAAFEPKVLTMKLSPGSSSTGATSKLDQNLNIDSLPVGEAVDLFYRFGFFSLSVRVVPRDDPGQWLIREPTSKVFQSFAEKVTPTQGSFDNDLKIYLCDDVAELEQAYFTNFKASGVTAPYKLFTGSWHDTTRAKYFGLSADMFDGDSSFVLIKLSLDAVTLSMADQPTLSNDIRQALASLQNGDENSIGEFIEQHGSHYIETIQVGDAVYQVLALKKDQYRSLKSDLQTNSNQQPLGTKRFDELFNAYLAPWVTRQSGQVQCASGSQRLQSFLDTSLTLKAQFDSYPNIFALQGDDAKQAELNALSSESSGA